MCTFYSILTLYFIGPVFSCIPYGQPFIYELIYITVVIALLGGLLRDTKVLLYVSFLTCLYLSLCTMGNLMLPTLNWGSGDCFYVVQIVKPQTINKKRWDFRKPPIRQVSSPDTRIKRHFTFLQMDAFRFVDVIYFKLTLLQYMMMFT